MEEFITTSYRALCSDLTLMEGFRVGLEEEIQMVMPHGDPNWSLAQYINFALWIAGSSLQIGEMEDAPTPVSSASAALHSSPPWSNPPPSVSNSNTHSTQPTPSAAPLPLPLFAAKSVFPLSASKPVYPRTRKWASNSADLRAKVLDPSITSVRSALKSKPHRPNPPQFAAHASPPPVANPSPNPQPFAANLNPPPESMASLPENMASPPSENMASPPVPAPRKCPQVPAPRKWSKSRAKATELPDPPWPPEKIRPWPPKSPDPPWPPEFPGPPWPPDPPWRPPQYPALHGPPERPPLPLPGRTVMARDTPTGRGAICHVSVSI